MSLCLVRGVGERDRVEGWDQQCKAARHAVGQVFACQSILTLLGITPPAGDERGEIAVAVAVGGEQHDAMQCEA